MPAAGRRCRAGRSLPYRCAAAAAAAATNGAALQRPSGHSRQLLLLLLLLQASRWDGGAEPAAAAGACCGAASGGGAAPSRARLRRQLLASTTQALQPARRSPHLWNCVVCLLLPPPANRGRQNPRALGRRRQRRGCSGVRDWQPAASSRILEQCSTACSSLQDGRVGRVRSSPAHGAAAAVSSASNPQPEAMAQLGSDLRRGRGVGSAGGQSNGDGRVHRLGVREAVPKAKSGSHEEFETRLGVRRPGVGCGWRRWRDVHAAVPASASSCHMHEPALTRS